MEIPVTEIIKALKCSATTSHDTKECDKCPYLLLEDCTEDIEKIKEAGLVMPDMQKDGRFYWRSCDCDKICLDAAAALERMQQEG